MFRLSRDVLSSAHVTMASKRKTEKSLEEAEKAEEMRGKLQNERRIIRLRSCSGIGAHIFEKL